MTDLKDIRYNAFRGGVVGWLVYFLTKVLSVIAHWDYVLMAVLIIGVTLWYAIKQMENDRTLEPEEYKASKLL